MSDINEVVKAIIQTQIIAALTSGTDTIEKLVASALSQPVKIDPSGYNRKEVPFIDHLIGNMLRDAARESVAEVIREQQPIILAAVRGKLSADTIVEALTTAITGALGEMWNLRVTFENGKR